MLDYFFSESGSFVFLAHNFGDHVNVICGSPLEFVFPYIQLFQVSFFHMSNELSAVTNEGSFDGVYDGARAFLEAVRLAAGV